MARRNRCEIVGDDEVVVLHVFSRCVRMAFLCGVDPLTGACYDHRKQFIQDRLEAMASVFAIDVMAYAIISSHFYLVLRTRPDIVAKEQHGQAFLLHAILDTYSWLLATFTSEEDASVSAR